MIRVVLIVVLSTCLAACGSPRGKGPKGSNNPNNVSTNNTATNAATNASTNGAACGNGIVEAGEACDSGIQDAAGACPGECRAPACHTATLAGASASCSAVCSVEPVGCFNDDGCCTIGCDATTDNDCTNICGDGILDANELCDQNCPTTCGSPDACSLVELQGDPTRCSAQCMVRPIDFCQGGDGCCPSTCNANNDPDCGASCGNGALEPGESCDGNCPTSCDDGAVCTRDTLAGNAATCNVICLNDEIRVCTGGDGCCPVGCTNATDSDCSTTCGNGIIDAGETCDGNCPASCSDGNVCTRDFLRGSAATCSVECTYEAINVCQGGDGCCPNGCTSANDSDCSCTPSTCGQLGVMCGPTDNGCGGTLQCGTCSSGACSQGMCDGGMTTSVVGSACTSDADCAGDTINTDPFCLTAAEGYPGGYCSASCQFICNDFVSPCVAPLLLVGTCHAGCTTSADCRSGYTCQQVDSPLGVLSGCLP